MLLTIPEITQSQVMLSCISIKRSAILSFLISSAKKQQPGNIYGKPEMEVAIKEGHAAA